MKLSKKETTRRMWIVIAIGCVIALLPAEILSRNMEPGSFFPVWAVLCGVVMLGAVAGILLVTWMSEGGVEWTE